MNLDFKVVLSEFSLETISCNTLKRVSHNLILTQELFLIELKCTRKRWKMLHTEEDFLVINFSTGSDLIKLIYFLLYGMIVD